MPWRRYVDGEKGVKVEIAEAVDLVPDRVGHERGGPGVRTYPVIASERVVMGCS